MPVKSCSASCKRQPECSHFKAVADKEHITGQYMVVPRLALNRGEPSKFAEPFRRGLNQRNFSLFAQHHQQIHISQQEQFARITPAFPPAAAFLNVDAGEIRALKAVNKPFMDDYIVKIGHQCIGCPALSEGPSAPPRISLPCAVSLLRKSLHRQRQREYRFHRLQPAE